MTNPKPKPRCDAPPMTVKEFMEKWALGHWPNLYEFMLNDLLMLIARVQTETIQTKGYRVLEEVDETHQ
ncbi:MAG: hypothetical protein L0Z50_20930 [Verrucomicrobiales bacterium]|nr:hypothetical protein [Verrucomicrobiales bacterium]